MMRPHLGKARDTYTSIYPGQEVYVLRYGVFIRVVRIYDAKIVCFLYNRLLYIELTSKSVFNGKEL